MRPTDDLIRHIRQYKNAVVHTIAGVTALTDFQMLADHGLKVLILGYKMKGRGKKYYNEAVAGKICDLKKELSALAGGFDVLCFDNLALRQLEVKSRMPEEKWERCYMGDDSTSSFYVNLCDGTFSPSSLDELKLPIGELTAEEMFAKVKGRAIVH